MKKQLLIVIFGAAQFAMAQHSFYDVYNKVLKIRDNYSENYKRKNLAGDKDSLLLLEQNSQEYQQMYMDIGNVSGKVVNRDFPDITFTDQNENSHMISDFKGELIVNYNYPYCMTCINRIDSTQKRTDKKPVKILVLFLETYKKDISFLKTFNENVLIGFVSYDTRQLISLTMGYDCMYYLDEDHRIEFFDRGSDQDWTKFLDEKID